MNAAQNILESQSTPVVLAGALLVAAAAVAVTSAVFSRPDRPAVQSQGLPRKKGKTKRAARQAAAGSSGSTEAAQPIIVPFPKVVPGDFELAGAAAGVGAEAPQPKPKAKKAKKKKKPKAGGSAANLSLSTAGEPSDAPSSDHPRAPPSTESAQRRVKPSAVDTDSSWTRVEPRRGKSATRVLGTEDVQPGGGSDAYTLSANTDNSSPVRTARTDEDDDGKEDEEDEARSEARPAWTERIKPGTKPSPNSGKTAVDEYVFPSDQVPPVYFYSSLHISTYHSMLEAPHIQTARVMRVRPRPDEKPPSGFTWADYEDVHIDTGDDQDDDGAAAAAGNEADGEDDGWGVVKSRGRSSLCRIPIYPPAQPF
jgi:hypothetical protein